ncbi:acetyltransferase [Companilactobacillus nodensis DSM 19682 = JCM 14932 = NBRC 107160]|uniref:Acetyltransferase n=1 Tax=Companilactobacillus nodensis DSM 19682 = JCM 14932 = NBRC 107160 TaxID=1423775 RepID=A0A0R1KJF2_9LACO|nr:acetyltransferase [Companilactobacillus nodensis DSM 19682 = JCM 14932 = NBRC 107160]
MNVVTDKTSWRVDDEIELRIVRPDDDEALFKQVDATRDQLVEYMPWAEDTKTAANERRFLKYCQKRIAAKALWPVTILVNGEVAGMFDFHDFDHPNRHCSIGYWLGKEFQHNGVMTRTVEAAVKIGFNELKMHKINILAEVENASSNAVAVRCGFHLDGTLQDHIYSDGKFHNANIYSLVNEAEK